jgi:hypothetical protein
MKILSKEKHQAEAKRKDKIYTKADKGKNV